MPEFENLQNKINQAREQKAAAESALSSARQRAKRIQSELDEFERSFDPRRPDHVERRSELEQARKRAETEVRRMAAAEREASALVTDLAASFAAFSDPRANISRWSDAFPILLMPVRLETRFKTIDENARAQLWVRIYPDACMADSFEETLSESEVRCARSYWQEMWRAGGTETGERAAWRALVGSVGSGRASWIVAQYVPVNIAEKPQKISESDIILVIGAEAPLPPAEQAAALAYWRQVWLADNDRDVTQAAFDALRNSVGGERAGVIAAQYRPFNLDDKPARPLTRDAVSVSASFVIFPAEVETKRESWTRAPKASVLPDRFVLIGYEGRTPTVEVLGNPIHSPLVLGPDPSIAPEEGLHQQDGDLAVPDDLLWMVDFGRAVEWGLGFRVNLTAAQARNGFDRLLVVGVRLSADAAQGKDLLEELFRHHSFGRSGFSLVPQGLPTNNTDQKASGYSRLDDPDASFDALKKAALFTETADELRKPDGQWLAELLGIDTEALRKVPFSDGADQSEARAMNIAMWPATLGYSMDTLMQPVFSDDAVEFTRWFFTGFVSGRGPIPAIRVGKQPYGILATTALSRLQLRTRETAASVPQASFLAKLLAIFRTIDSDWAELARNIPYAGKSGDPHQTLLDILGLHPASVEFHYRFAESLEQLFNRLNFGGLGGALIAALIASGYVNSGLALLARLGYSGADTPDALNKIFFGSQGRLTGPVIDDRPLSETESIRAYTTDGRNYLQWLADAARTSLEALRAQQGFIDNQPPTALLYLMLRHALLLGYYNTSYNLRLAVDPPERLRAMRREPPFIHIQEQAAASESRFAALYTTDARITQSATLTIADYITASFGTLAAARQFAEQTAALDVLKSLPTARLERLFAEHLDCCSYRFDAWYLGLVNYQLRQMRYARKGEETTVRKGIYLGAFGWVENLRPEDKQLTAVDLQGELAEVFRDPEPLVRDSSNGGFIHAPSLTHAATAAVLRNGYISDASPDNAKTLAVNISSERVRAALSILEGMRNGQSLGALLGYQMERGLHDRYAVAEVDRFIYPLRKAFPLRADRIPETRTGPGDAIEAIEARNVLDGLRLVEHIRRTGNAAYPFGLDLPPAGPAATVITAEAARLLDTHDAVADVALTEGVHQAVQGNYDRVTANLDAFARSNYPPDPDVVKTPTTGVALTHRVGLHLEPGLSAPAVDPTPRSSAEPAINKWLAGILPPLDSIACKVQWKDPVNATDESATVRMSDLRLQPLDLLYMVQSDPGQGMTEMDDRVLRRVYASKNPRPDAVLAIVYMDPGDAQFSVFAASPLLRSLRSLALRARPLRASDIALPNDATPDQEQSSVANRARVAGARTALDNLRTACTGFLGAFPAGDAAILAGIDALIDGAADLLASAATCGIPQTTWGFLYESRRAGFTAILEAVRGVVARWEKSLGEFDEHLAAYDALPPATIDEVRFEMLHRMERFVSSTYTPLPPAPATLRAALAAKRTAFTDRLNDFRDVLSTGVTSVATLVSNVESLSTAEFDSEPFSIDEEKSKILVAAADIQRIVSGVAAEANRRVSAVDSALAAHDASASASARLDALVQASKAALGEDFRIVPEFPLQPDQGDEWENALSPAAQTALVQFLTAAGDDFPVDEWMYGAARVRDMMRAWEETIILAEAFGRPAPALVPIQLPYRAGAPWLALRFPGGTNIRVDYVLYTAHYAVPFDKTAPQCGLLIDEWPEVIPLPDPDTGFTAQHTGLTFHFDRPNCEAPQSMLLVSPATHSGEWQWEDVVGALYDTLELAKKRAVEPVHLDATAYARFLPATVMAVTTTGISIATALALNNGIVMEIEHG